MEFKVFIENEANSNQKNLYDEKSLTFIETIQVAKQYPFPYGFVLDTTAEDKDNVDVFVLTNRKLRSGEIVSCKAIGLMEQFEKSWDESLSDFDEIDHNVLGVISDEEEIALDKDTTDLLTEFVLHIFDNIKKNKTKVGRFLSKEEANKYINESRDSRLNL